MGAFRWIAVALLAFFLLGPMLKSVVRETEKPLVVLALDNSESLVAVKDSSYLRAEFPEAIKNLVTDLSDKYDVRTYLFGDEVRDGNDLTFSDKRTNMSSLFEEIRTRYSNRNLGAVVVAGDGIYNTGSNPVYVAEKLKVPVYTIALGDTSVRKDALISNVAHNRLAYLGNKFPLEVVVEGKRLTGQSTVLRVVGKGGVLFSKTIDFDNGSYLGVVPIQLEAKHTGLQRLRVEIAEVQGEVTLVNNVRDIYIDVLDSRQKILMVAHSPHPDIGALKRTIAGNDNYELKVVLANDFDGKLDPYSLVILHQLPSRQFPATDLLKDLHDKQVPTLFILGQQTNYGSFNALQVGVTNSGNNGRLVAATGSISSSFTLFNVDQETSRLISKWPPLHCGFGTWNKSRSADVLSFQRIGFVDTQYPLIAFDKVNDTKVGVIAGEGLWRWRIQDFAQEETHEHFDGLITKMVQYMASKEDKSKFRVYGENSFLENERIVFEGELYNESYELINDPDVSMSIKNSEGNEFPFQFSKSGNAYRLDAGNLPVGEYSYTASVTYNGELMKETGEFSVNAIQVEHNLTVANHQLMYQLADRLNGEMVMSDEIAGLSQMIASHDEIVPVTYTRKSLTDLINRWWIFWVIVALLTLEWYMRKRHGTY